MHSIARQKHRHFTECVEFNGTLSVTKQLTINGYQSVTDFFWM